MKIAVMAAKGSRSFTESQRQCLESLGEVKYIEAFRPLARADFISALHGAALVGLTPRGTPPLDVVLLKSLPSLKAVVIPTTGSEWIDTACLEKAGIRWENVPGFSTDSTAEFTIGLMLSVVRKIPLAIQRSRDGGRTDTLIGRELKGQTLGVIGWGNIGSRVGELARAFGMRVMAHDILPSFQNLDSVLKESDIVSLHVPLNVQTKGLFTIERLSQMKGAILLNTARPGLIDSNVLLEALQRNFISGYAFDYGYLHPEDIQSLLRHPKIVAVPHISWYTREAVARESEGWVEKILEVGKELISLASAAQDHGKDSAQRSAKCADKKVIVKSSGKEKPVNDENRERAE